MRDCALAGRPGRGAGDGHTLVHLPQPQVHQRGAVVSARVPDAGAARLQSIMDRSAVNVRERAAAYRQTGWESFNSNEGPYTADQVRKERELYMRR